MFKDFFTELQLLFQTLTEWIILLLIFTVFFFTCNIETIAIWGKVFDAPVLSNPSFSAELFTMMVRDVVPSHIPMIVTGPTVAFFAQIKIALLLAVIFTLPVFFAKLLQYLSPALHKTELITLCLTTIPSTVLFASGALFAYIFVVPQTFAFLYTFTDPISVSAFLSVQEFIGITLALLFATGLAFTLPVAMVLLTSLSLIPASFWRQKFRHAVVLLLVVSAIITPDGSGISMLLMTAPVSALYGIGALICVRVEKVSQRSHVGSSIVNN